MSRLDVVTDQHCAEMLSALLNQRTQFECLIGTIDVELLERAVKCLRAQLAPPGRVSLTLETSQPVFEALEQMVATGLFGRNVCEAAEQLMRERLREVEGRFDADGSHR
jgi:hypothetical protein